MFTGSGNSEESYVTQFLFLIFNLYKGWSGFGILFGEKKHFQAIT